MLPAILVYHSVSERARDPLKLALPPRTFAEHMAWLARHTTPLPLVEFVARLQNGRLPGDAVAVTFDDGYRDNVEMAAPVLREHQVPATVFVATDYVGGTGEGWWDELDAILLEAERLPPRFIHGALSCDVEPHRDRARDGWTVLDAPVTARERAFLNLSAHAGTVSRPERESLLAALRAWSGYGGQARPGRAFATWAELAEAVNSGWLSVGAHTRSHPVLARRPVNEQIAEIAGSMADIRLHLRQDPAGLAYPFGTFHDFSPTTARVACDVGLGFACANMVGRLSARTNRWQLPRLLVWNWSAHELARRLGR